MDTEQNEARRAGVDGALDESSLLGGENNQAYPSKSAPDQAGNTVIDAARRFRRAPARRSPVLPIRISAGGYGRSKIFQLSTNDLCKLLEAAELWECRP